MEILAFEQVQFIRQQNALLQDIESYQNLTQKIRKMI
jgi:hypothetical protein